MGQTCCGPRTTSKAIKRLEGSELLKKGQVDEKVAEALWEMYVGKDAKETDYTTLLNSTMYSDYLIAQQHLIKTYIKEDLTGYTEDEDRLKTMKDEKNMRKKRGKQLLDGINVGLHNDDPSGFVTSIFGMKDKKPIQKISKENFIKKYCNTVKIGLGTAAGTDLNMEALEKDAASGKQ